MIPPDIVTKYSGPPGTGKSTTLLNVVESLLSSGVEPERIVFTTFTRAGAYEARDRACARFRLSPARLPYFKTLHALCFGLLPSADVLDAKDWGVIASTIRVFFSAHLRTGDYLMQGHTKGDFMLSVWALARVKREPVEQVLAARFRDNTYNVTMKEMQHFIDTVESYKREHNRIDFMQMLEQWLEHGELPDIDYVIIDEAQDLSYLQWLVVQKLCRRARKVYVAGDDDQCIHEWNGASPMHFIDLGRGKYEVLGQSYRIPQSVHTLAQTIIARVGRRLPKEYRSREEPGKVERINGLDHYQFHSGSWLLLARDNWHLEQYEEAVRRRGLLYTMDKSLADDTKALRAITIWRELAKGAIPASDAKFLYGYLSQRDRVTRGFKGRLQLEPDSRMLTHADLKRDFGLIVPVDMAWTKALDMMDEAQRIYLELVEKHEGSLGRTPRIRISTIHGAKGQEADHVVVCPDMTNRCYDSYQAHPDAEHRVFYVGVTRARQSLHLLNARTPMSYPL